jgi:hypothetical protein
MNKVKVFWQYKGIDIDTEKRVELYIDHFPRSIMPDDMIRIVLFHEPYGVLQPVNSLRSMALQYQERYTYLLTYEEYLLERIPKAQFFIAMDTWIPYYVPSVKKFSVSTVVGGKVNDILEGYEVRRELWSRQDEIKIPKDFYLSGRNKWTDDEGKLLGEQKEPMFDSMFHICIENTSIKNFFTEKIIDCFQAHCIPIYYGCKNIHEFFNPDGIIRVNSVDELINACNRLTPECIYTLQPAVEENYTRSLKYLGYKRRIEETVKELING